MLIKAVWLARYAEVMEALCLRLVHIRLAAGADQIKVLEWLVRKYPKQAKQMIN